MKSRMPIPEEFRKQIRRDANEMARKIIGEQIEKMHEEITRRCILSVLLTIDDCFCDLFGETEAERLKNYERFTLAFTGQIANYNRDCYEWDESKNPFETSQRMQKELEERGLGALIQ